MHRPARFLFLLLALSQYAHTAEIHHRDGIHRLPKATAVTSLSTSTAATALCTTEGFPTILPRAKSKVVTTVVCPGGYNICNEDAGGGCCPDGYECAKDSCTATTRGPTTCAGTAGAYACPASVGGGCCMIGKICAGINYCKTPTITSSTVPKTSATPTTITSTAPPTTTSNSNNITDDHLSTAAIIGISIGSVAAVLLFAIGFLLIRSHINLTSTLRRRRSPPHPSKNTYATISTAQGTTRTTIGALSSQIQRPPGPYREGETTHLVNGLPEHQHHYHHQRNDSEEGTWSPGADYWDGGTTDMSDRHMPAHASASWFNQNQAAHGRSFSGVSSMVSPLGSPGMKSPELLGALNEEGREREVFEMPLSHDRGRSLDLARDEVDYLGVPSYGSLGERRGTLISPESLSENGNQDTEDDHNRGVTS